VSQHRAPRRRLSRRESQALSRRTPSPSATNGSTGRHAARHRATPAPSQPTQQTDPSTTAELPAVTLTSDVRLAAPARSTQSSPGRATSAPGFIRPSPSIVAGTAALVVAAAGAVSVGSAQASERDRAAGEESSSVTQQASGFGSDTDRLRAADAGVSSDAGGGVSISRSSAREPINTGNDEQAAAEAVAKRAKARDAALEKLAALADERAEELESNQWVLPVDSYRLTATFGQGGGLWSSDHTGLDFAAAYGTPIKAVGHGIVTSVGYEGAYGNQTTITHSDGTQTSYSHMASSAVSTGEEVNAGDVIGYIGMTGNTTGPHLHFEVLTDPETPVDPYGVLVEHGVNP
jgi:murein DD-endopeptidase MepM/ murein hydrolase activator NlpD